MTKEYFNQLSKGHFPAYLGIEIVEVEKPFIKAEMQIKEQFIAPNKFLHAGSIVTFADTVAGYSTLLNLPEGAKSFTTLELKCNFIRTTKSGTIECTSEIEHLGRTTQIWRVVVVNKETKKKMASFSCTQLILY